MHTGPQEPQESDLAWMVIVSAQSYEDIEGEYW